jgi:hypothetical protein
VKWECDFRCHCFWVNTFQYLGIYEDCPMGHSR